MWLGLSVCLEIRRNRCVTGDCSGPAALAPNPRPPEGKRQPHALCCQELCKLEAPVHSALSAKLSWRAHRECCQLQLVAPILRGVSFGAGALLLLAVLSCVGALHLIGTMTFRISATVTDCTGFMAGFFASGGEARTLEIESQGV